MNTKIIKLGNLLAVVDLCLRTTIFTWSSYFGHLLASVVYHSALSLLPPPLLDQEGLLLLLSKVNCSEEPRVGLFLLLLLLVLLVQPLLRIFTSKAASPPGSCA